MAAVIKVLYVDDEEALLDIGKIFLEESGDLSVATIESARAALALLKMEQYDAIVSDYLMPGMDGIQFLVEVRSLFGSIPFILFTGKGREEVVIQAINCGADFYLQKGGDPGAQFAELTHNIKKAVESRRAEKEILASRDMFSKSEADLHVHQTELEMQAEELRESKFALEESRDKYLDLYEFAPLGYLMLTDKALIKEINLTGAALLGVERKNLQMALFSNFISPEYSDQWYQYFMNVKKQDSKQTCTITLLRKDGSTFPARLESIRIPGSSIETPTVRVAISDISDIRKAEETLHSQNRALLLISSAESLMMHTTEEQTLLDEICAMITGAGGYRMAWIGFAIKDDTRSVRPVAQSGFEDGYLDTIKITWADAVRGRGPTGTAIRTGGYCIARNIRNDPAYGPWRDAAIQHGYQSSIALPLEGKGEIFGALNIYSGEPDRFDEDEIQLLSQLARDLSFGIQTLRSGVSHGTAERALLGSDEKIRLLLNSTAEAIYGLDMNGNCTFCNTSCLRLLGYQHPDELLGRNMHWLIHAKHRDGTPYPLEECHIFQAFKKGEGTHVDDEVLWRSDGTPFSAEYWSYPQRHEGVVVGAVVTFMDITGRRRVEDALRDSEEKYRLIVENSRDIIYSLSATGTFLYLSPSISRILGYQPDDLIGHPFTSIIHPDDIASLQEVFSKSISEDYATGGIEYRVRHRSGEWRWHISRGHAVHDAAGNILNFTGIANDITERKKTDDKLRLAYSRLDSAMEAGSIAWWEMDCSTGNVTFSERKARMLGYPAEQFSHYHDFTRLLHPDDYEPAMQAMRDHLSGIKKQYETDYRIRTRNGEYHWFHDTGSVSAFTPDGKPSTVTGFVIDITERKVAEEGLVESEQKYRELFEGSHDAIMILEPPFWKFTSGNKASLALFRIHGEAELLTLGPWDLAPDNQPDGHNSVGKAREMIETTLQNGSSSFEWMHKRIDGSEFLSTILLTRMERHGTVFLQATVRDITDRKRAEEQLRIKNIVFESSIAANSIADNQGILTSVNAAFLYTWGYWTKEDVIGKSLGSFFADEKDLVQIFEVLGTFGRWEGEFTARLADDSTFIAHGVATVIRDDAGKQIGYQSTVLDVTDNKRIEKEQENIRSWQIGVNRILESVLAPTPLDHKLKIITNGVVEIFGADFCRIWLIEKGDLCDVDCMHAGITEGAHTCRYRDKCLHLKASSGRYTHLDGKAHRRVPFGAYKIGLIASGEETKFLTNDVEHDPRVHDHAWAKSLGLVAFSGYRLKPPDGEVLGVFALFSRFPISPDMDALLDGLSRALSLAIQKDIADKALRNSLADLARAQQVANIGSWSLKPVTNELAWSDQMHEIFTVPKTPPVTYEVFLESVHPDDRKHTRQVLAEALDGTLNFFDREYRITIQGDHVRNIYELAEISRDEQGIPLLVFGTAQDVTERILAGEILKESERKYRTLIEKANEGIFIIQEGLIPFVNPKALEIFGFSPEDLAGKPFFEIVHPEDRQEAVDRYQRRVLGEFVEPVAFSRVIDRKNTIHWLEINAVMIAWNGRPATLNFVTDITERRLAEEALRESEEKYRTLIENIPDVVYRTDNQGILIMISPSIMQVMGYDSVEECLGKNIAEKLYFQPEKRRDFIEALQKNGSVKDFEVTLKRKDGSPVTVATSSHYYFDKTGNVLGVEGVFRDISERKRAEELLRQNQLQLATAMDLARMVNWEYEVRTGEFTFDDRFYEFYGTTAEREGGNRMSAETYVREFVHPEDIYGVGNVIQKLLETTDPLYRGQMEHRIMRRDGEIRTIIARYAPVMGPDGKVIRTFGANQDITERKMAEAELMFKNALLSTQQETLPGAILIVNENGKILNYNQNFVEMWGIPDDIIASRSNERALQSVIEKLEDPEAFLARISYLSVHIYDKSYEEIRLTDGRILDRYSAPMFGDQQRYFGRVWYFRDITSLKKSEAALLSSLHEKELLLKEIHHRVKNNLQTIASLLYLQSLSTDDEGIKMLLNEARSRVYAMGLIHQKLYQSADITRIRFTDYISQLIDYLKESYGVDETKTQISVSVKPEDLFLELDAGIPCGLIINELVMNALKYAFLDRPGGTITIRMEQDGLHQNILSVSDDGRGIPADFDLTTMRSLGMTIVSSLVRQLGGTMEMVRKPGTTITIRFPTHPLPAPEQPESAEKPAAEDHISTEEKIRRIRTHHD